MRSFYPILSLAFTAVIVTANAGPAPASTHTNVVSHPTSSRIERTTGFLEENSGSGPALSPLPGLSVQSFEFLQVWQVSGAYRLNEVVAGSQCNNGRVSFGTLDCPWTGNLTNLDKRYDNDPIFAYQIHDDTRLCADSTEQRVNDYEVWLAGCTSAQTYFVAESGNGGRAGELLNVSATQTAGARRVLCGQGSSSNALLVSPGSCPSSEENWAFTVPANR